MSAPTYDLYGLRIRSEIPLKAPPAGSDTFDLDVTLVERWPVPGEPPAGDVVAAFSFGPDFGYTHTADGLGYTLRYHSVADFRVDRQLRAIRVHLAPEQSADYAALLLMGNVIATVLMLSGECVLHASAVEIGGRAVAFVGHSGMGKSTLAALCCAAGARLVTDDLLRVSPEEPGAFCHRGTAAIRLRPSAVANLADLPEANLQPAVDDRSIVEARPADERRPRLSVIVIPQLARAGSEIEICRLSPANAVYQLAAYPRVVGWRSPEIITQQFHLLGRLVKQVPICKAVVPWGPPFAPDLAASLLNRLDHSLDCNSAAP